MSDQDKERDVLIEALANDSHFCIGGKVTVGETTFTCVDEQTDEAHRWQTPHTTVFKAEPSGRHWAFDWWRGNTECQEHTIEPSAETVYEVEVRQKIVTAYVRKEQTASQPSAAT